MLSSHGRGIGPQDALKGESRGILELCQETLDSLYLCQWPQGASHGAYGKSGILWSWEGPLGTLLGLVQWKRASSQVEVGTSAFLSCSDVGLSLCMPFQTVSHVPTCVEAWKSAFLSSCQRGFRPPTEFNLGPGALFGFATGASELPSCFELILTDIRISARKSGLISSG